MDHGWVHEFRADMDCGADGVVQTDETEDEVAVDRTSASPQGRPVHGVRSQTDSRNPSLRQLPPINGDRTPMPLALAVCGKTRFLSVTLL